MDSAASPVLRGFGGVAAHGPTGPVDLGGPKPRAVLALLMLEPGVVVSLDRITDLVWGDAPPTRADVSVRGYVSNLRKALASAGLGPGEIVEFRDRGYVLLVAPEAIDLHRFEVLIDDGRRLERLGDLTGARRLLVEALDLYLGPPLGSTAEELGLGEVTTRFDERRGEAVEALFDVRLALGEHSQLPAALAPEIAREPYREHLRAQLALALYRSGRPVEALRSLDETRRILLDDIGVDPGPELVSLESAILVHDESVLAWVAPSVPGESEPPVGPVAETTSEDEVRFGRGTEEELSIGLLDRLPSRGGVLVVAGEAGIGKTAMLRGLRAEALRRGVTVGWDRCPESAAGAPYRSWRSAVEALLPASSLEADVRTPEQEAAGALLTTHLRELDRLRQRTEPAVVVIDDLQWADDPTLALLEFLAPELERLRILLAVGVRRTGSTELPPAVRDCLAELARTPDPLHVTLAGIGSKDVADWVASRSGSSPDPALVAYVAETTDGNPFYVRELIALLESDGRLAGAFEEVPAAVPHAVQDVVRRRTSQLPPDTQAVLTVAAVVGRRFDLDVLAHVLDLSLPEVIDRIEPALDDGLVEADDSVAGRFAFSHALVSGTLVAELNAARLAAHHARITDALEELRAADLDPWVEDLSHHAALGLVAGTAPKSLRYATRAADAAEAVQSPTDVALQLDRAVAAAALIPGFPGEERRALLWRLGSALRDSGDPRGREVLVEAARLAEAQGDLATLAEILGRLDTESLWASYDWSLHDPVVTAAIERARSHPGLTDRDRAVLTMALAGELTYVENERSNELFEEARDIAEPLDDVVLTARILLQWFWSVSGTTGVGMRASIGDQLIALDAEGALPTRLRPLAHLSRVSSALELGDGELARTCVARAREVAHPVRTPTGWAHLQFTEAGLAMLDGDLERSRAHVGALRPAMQRVRQYTAESSSACILAVIEAESGETDAAVGNLEILLASPYAEPIRWLEAWILARGGRLDEAKVALAGFDGPLPDDWLRLTLTTAAISAAAAVGDTRFLERHLPVLEPTADRFAFPGEGGLTVGPVALAMAEAHVALGDPVAARIPAEQAVAISERIGAALWLPRARQFLESLPTT